MIGERSYDTVIVGAGPIGMTTACLVKVLNPNAKICVLEKNQLAKRSHGLKIASDSVNQIIAVLDRVLKQIEDEGQNKNEDRIQNISLLKNTFVSWKNSGFVRTNQIEMTLAERAHALGIGVFRGEAYAITPEFIGKRPELSIVKKEDPVKQSEFEKEREKVRKIFDQAKIIIGADGAHSAVRREIMGNELIEEASFQYMVEFKYQINSNANLQSKIEVCKQSTVAQDIVFENIGKGNGNEKKPATFRAFVDKKTYDALRQNETDADNHVILGANNKPRLKGVFGNSWTLSTLKEEIEKKRNAGQVKIAGRMNRMLELLNFYVSNIQSKNNSCSDEQISALELKVFLSKHTVKKFGDQYALLVGDANSGMVLERGFNMGLIESIHCAQAITTHLENQAKPEHKAENSQEIPKEFEAYEKTTHALYRKEKWWAGVKNFWINVARRVIAFFSKYIYQGFKLNPITTTLYE